MLRPGGLLAGDDPEACSRLAAVARMIAGSPSLLARERQVYDDYTLALAQLLAAETSTVPDDVRAWVVANALMGVHRAQVDHVRAQVLAGRTAPEIAHGVRARGGRRWTSSTAASPVIPVPARSAATAGVRTPTACATPAGRGGAAGP